MLIRFPNFVQHGNVQHNAGDVLDLPEEFAKIHIGAGHAVELPPAEAAVMPLLITAPAPQQPKPRKPAKKKERR